MKPFKHIFIAVVVLSVLGSAFDGISIGLLVPLLNSVQQMAGGQKFPMILRWLTEFLHSFTASQQILLSMGFVLLAVLLKDLFLMLSVRLGHWLSARLLANLRAHVMALLMRVSIAFHHQANAVELIQKAVANTSNIEWFFKYTTELLANFLTLVMLVAMLFILSWQFTLFTLLLGVIFFRVIYC